MARHSTTTADRIGEMFPPGEDIELPRDRKAKKRGGVGTLIVGGTIVVLGLGGTYLALSKKDVTPANYPTEPIVDTRPVPKAEIPEGLAEKGIVILHAAQKTETPAKEIEKHILTDLAVVKDKVVYPDNVDKTLLGGYKYNFKEPEQVALAVVEGLNNRNENLLKTLTGGTDMPYKYFKPEGKLAGEILNYELIGISRFGHSPHGVYLKIRLKYKGKIFEAKMRIGLGETDNGDIRFNDISLEYY